MAAYLCPPAVIHGEHAVETSQIVAEVRDRHPHAPWAPRVDGIAQSTGIGSRGWMLPLETAVAPGSGGGLGAVGAAPVQEALARDGFAQQDVDRVIAALEAIPAPQTVQERTAPAWEAVQAYGERAARGALQIAGLDAADVDCLITSHSTTPALPGLTSPCPTGSDCAATRCCCRPPSGRASREPAPWPSRRTSWPRIPTGWSWS